MKKFQTKIDLEKCKACSLCIINCPQKILILSKELNSKGYTPVKCVNQEKCIGCSKCAIICPEAAIEILPNLK